MITIPASDAGNPILMVGEDYIQAITGGGQGKIQGMTLRIVSLYVSDATNSGDTEMGETNIARLCGNDWEIRVLIY